MKNGSAEPLVSMCGIDKIFFGAYANKGVDFNLAAGENGAGKTTLMNVLSGIYAPDAGTVRLDGREARFRSPRDAIDRGIGMVHQHFMLIPVLSVWENIILSMRGLPFVTDKRGTTEKIMELSERYSLAVDPEAMVWTLSIGERQRVEILKMLYRGTKVLILDEPTSVLTPQEVRVFFAAMRRMMEAGHGIVIISHKIEEILSIASRMTILRKGERVATVEAKDTTRETLARMMVGRELKNVEKTGAPRSREAVLSCRGLSVRNDRGARALDGVSFDLRKGEILGLAGLAGGYLSVVYSQMWVEGMTAGRGWIAVALVIFGIWRPLRAMFGCYLFGSIDALQLRMQAAGTSIPAPILLMLPYLMTLGVLVFISVRSKSGILLGAPASLGTPFRREERE